MCVWSHERRWEKCSIKMYKSDKKLRRYANYTFLQTNVPLINMSHVDGEDKLKSALTMHVTLEIGTSRGDSREFLLLCCNFEHTLTMNFRA